jgi:hypothetical protein
MLTIATRPEGEKYIGLVRDNEEQVVIRTQPCNVRKDAYAEARRLRAQLVIQKALTDVHRS